MRKFFIYFGGISGKFVSGEMGHGENEFERLNIQSNGVLTSVLGFYQ